MITTKDLEKKLLEELRLDVYLDDKSQYAYGREDATRHVLVLLGYEKDKLITVKDIDKLLGVLYETLNHIS